MRRAAIITATLIALGLAACGDDEDTQAGATTATAVAAAGDPDRYCQIVRELDTSGEDFFAGLGEDSSPEEYEAAERRFVERYSDTLEELERVAPSQIRSDVAVLLAGQRERAGLSTTTTPESKSSASEKRVQAYEKRNCDG